jgi:thiamine pyrophosphokinase
MTSPAALPLRFDGPVLLIGGGRTTEDEIAVARPFAAAVVAADGGANRLPEGGLRPDAVIGDMDSVERAERWREDPRVRFVQVAEQDSTDFEKCLRLTRAPLYLGVGFLGPRMDHALAALRALVRFADRRILLVGEREVAFLAPPAWRMRLEAGARVSVFPMRACVASGSEGLRWPLDPLALEAGSVIGTSNRAVADEVALRLDRPGAAILLERRFLGAAVESLRAAEGWS